MTLSIPFDNSYARLPDALFHRQAASPVTAPSLIAWNTPLAEQLGITGTADPQVLAGNSAPEGAEPLAQLYSGHQFGQWNPQLGDGRALLLGEVVDQDGIRRDIQLKGSGPTPYSRRGDGRAALGPVLREYVVSEAMHALGIPTTRALAAVRTGEDVIRDRPLPGAVLTRVAQSHIRVGTFQVLAARQMTDELRALFDHVVDRHYPSATDPVDLLRQVCTAQADLVAAWLSIGFIHGVMNTDNCSIPSETIDYGPCAFMEAYNPETVYSSIDRRGRYAYAAQADVIVWNMAQLATALMMLMPDSDASIKAMTDVVHGMGDTLRARWLARFAAKIGISTPEASDARLIGELMVLMDSGQADFTNTFRALADGSARDQFTDRGAFDTWEAAWRKRLDRETDDPAALMTRVNPAIIPRNHQIEEMISKAEVGDDSLFHRLNGALANPYDAPEQDADLRRPATKGEAVRATFCGT